MSSARVPASETFDLLVVMLTCDENLRQHLANDLVALNGQAEFHTAENGTALLDHLERVRADALIIDTHGLTIPQTSQMLTRVSSLVPAIFLLSDSNERLEVPELESGVLFSQLDKSSNCMEIVVTSLRRIRRSVQTNHLLRETVLHYKDILEASSDGIFVLTHGVFTFVNESFAQSLKYEVEELVGIRELTQLAHASDRMILGEELARIAVGERRREILEANLIDKQGDSRCFEIACRSSVVDGHRTVVGVARDVTALREIQEEIERARQRASQVDRLRALGELAAGVAHDFNNALESILGRVTLAREKLARGEDPSDDLAVIQKAASSAADTVSRVQQFSHAPDSESWHEVDLAQVAREAAELIETRVPTGIKLNVRLEPTPKIRGNASELKEVLLNLLGNALDAIRDVGDIGLQAFQQDGNAVVEITDTGSGMSQEVQQKIFEPFFSTKGQTGTGLGLSVSHRILRRHDAQISLQSEPNRGTRFRLTFTPMTPPMPATKTLDPGPMTIAVIDDDTSVAELMKDLLEEIGHHVVLLAEPEKAPLFVAENEVQLLITDLDLPTTSGWQLARSVRRVRSDIRVGLVTGWPLGATREELQSRGVDFVLSKPFSMEALAAALAQLFRR